MNEKVNNAISILDEMSMMMHDAEKKALEAIKDVLRPCKGGACLLGSEDFCDDIFYVYGEPKPNVFRRATAIRLNETTDELELLLEGEPIGYMNEDGWTELKHAYIGDVQFLVEEVSNNIEYSDGYQDGEEE